MASNASISGLASGLDTATIISQLMQLEAQPQTQLKSRVTAEQKVLTALQSLNTKTAALTTKAATLADPASWSAVRGTSSNTSVTVATANGAQPTSFSLTVTSVARTHQLGFTNAAALTDHVTGSSNTVLLDRLDGTGPVSVTTSDGTLQGLANAINDPANATGLRATTVKTAGGYRLLVESAVTGAAQDFTLTAADGSALLGGATVRAGSDAALDLGAGITVTSTTNTFADVVPGVTLTLASGTAVGTTSTVDVKQDVAGLSSSVADLVSSLNAILSDIDTGTAHDATTKISGVLSGDPLVRDLRSKLLDTVFPATGTMATVGVSTDRNGKLVFDATKFAAAYAADPAGTAARFTSDANGFAARVQTVAATASDARTGIISAAVVGRQSGISTLQSSIDDWDLRLADRKEALTRQFTALETALSQMQSQSSWLSSQLSSLSAGG